MLIKLIAIPFSILAYFWFLFSLCLFHPIQWICLKAFGYQAHKRSVDFLDLFLMLTPNFLLSTSKCENIELIPMGKPIIFVANHQGIFDIVGMAWFLRKFHPKFVSKIELGRNIPSIS